MEKFSLDPAVPATFNGDENVADNNKVISDEISNDIDFTQATRNADGRLCVLKEEMVKSVVKEPLLQCTIKNIEKCHYTYITQFMPTQEEVKRGCVLFFLVCTKIFEQ